MSIYKNDDENNYLMIPICYVWGIVYAFGVVWGVNIIQWIDSVTIDSLLGSLFWADSRGLLYVIHTLVVMFFYIFVLPAAVIPLKYIDSAVIQKILIIILAISIIFLFDPHITNSYAPDWLGKIISFLQDKCYFRLIGGASFANLTWSESISEFEYGVFDFYVIVSSILTLLNKKII